MLKDRVKCILLKTHNVVNQCHFKSNFKHNPDPVLNVSISRNSLIDNSFIADGILNMSGLESFLSQALNRVVYVFVCRGEVRGEELTLGKRVMLEVMIARRNVYNQTCRHPLNYST